MVEVNDVEIKDIAGILLTTTPDINAEFPAAAARELGWTQVALLCGHEMDVPGSLPRCLRVLMLFNTEKSNEEIVHVYLREAQSLRTETGNNWLSEDKA
jgi:chorismate mutase